MYLHGRFLIYTGVPWLQKCPRLQTANTSLPSYPITPNIVQGNQLLIQHVGRMCPLCSITQSLLRFLSSNNKSGTSAVFHFPRERELYILHILFLTSRRAQFPNLNPSNFCIFIFLGNFCLFLLFHLGERDPGNCFSLNCPVRNHTTQPCYLYTYKTSKETPNP